MAGFGIANTHMPYISQRENIAVIAYVTYVIGPCHVYTCRVYYVLVADGQCVHSPPHQFSLRCEVLLRRTSYMTLLCITLTWEIHRRGSFRSMLLTLLDESDIQKSLTWEGGENRVNVGTHLVNQFQKFTILYLCIVHLPRPSIRGCVCSPPAVRHASMLGVMSGESKMMWPLHSLDSGYMGNSYAGGKGNGVHGPRSWWVGARGSAFVGVYCTDETTLDTSDLECFRYQPLEDGPTVCYQVCVCMYVCRVTDQVEEGVQIICCVFALFVLVLHRRICCIIRTVGNQ